MKSPLQSVHKGIKYDCSQCKYKATQQSYIVTHKQSLHKGLSYDCNHCIYKAKSHSFQSIYTVSK